MNKLNYFKKIIFTWMCLLLSSLLFSQQKNQNIQIITSTNEVLIFELKVPDFKINEIKTEKYGGFQRIMCMDDSVRLKGSSLEYFSTPEVPIISTLIAVPIGNDVDVKVLVYPKEPKISNQVRLYPIQKPKRDFRYDKEIDEFEFDEQIYKKSNVKSGIASWEPINPVGKDEFQKSNIYNLSLNLVDYDPNKGYLTAYTSIRVEILFKGNNKYFSAKKINENKNLSQMDVVDNWYEDQISPMEAGVLNYSVYSTYKYESSTMFQLFGSRFLIITHPDFLAAANTLKNHKISRGISTRVVTTDVTGTSAAEIKSYLSSAYSTWFVKPKWVLFIGDSEFIPTHYGSPNTWDNADNAGDIYYGQFGVDDTAIPSFGIGRFPVDTLAQANTMVNNVINFENNPPSSFFILDNPYYYRLQFAAEFQDYNFDTIDDRWFAETSEKIHDYLITQKMKVDRIYATKYSTIDPKFWHDGTPIPAYLQKPDFPWNGNSTDIINAVNGGTSLLYHRDHGWWDGWGTPSFNTAELSAISITNNEYPVVYSINCASGIFDNETVNPDYGIFYSSGAIDPTAVYWAETFVRKPDGAIAVIGDTRSSDTKLNNDLAIGLFDATWPNFKTLYGPDTSTKKLGDILNHAKGYLKSLGIFSASQIRQELKIYNLLGDPTVELKSRKQRKLIIIEPIFLEREIEIPLIFPELKIDPVSLETQPIFATAFTKENDELKIIGRGILEQHEFKEKASIKIQITEKSEADEIIVVISGNEIPTERRIINLR